MIEFNTQMVGKGRKPYFVAEISGNHEGDTKKAQRLISYAKGAGADAVKLQTYTPDMLTIDCDKPDFIIDDPVSPWHGRKLYDLYREAQTPLEWHGDLFSYAREIGITIFSSPFSVEAVDLLEKFNCPAYKIASFENNYLELINKCAKTGKPVIISTGASTVPEIWNAVSAARKAGCEKLILLKCSSRYPALTAESNLLSIPHMQKLFDCPVGISDHTLGIGAAVAATTLGACMIEKHIRLDDSYTAVDVTFSLTPNEFRQMKMACNQAWESLGQIKIDITESEKASLAFKRSIYCVEDVGQGERFTRNNIRIIRPGYGLSPCYYGFAMTSYASRSIKRGEPLKMEDIGG